MELQQLALFSVRMYCGGASGFLIAALVINFGVLHFVANKLRNKRTHAENGNNDVACWSPNTRDPKRLHQKKSKARKSRFGQKENIDPQPR